MAIELLLEDNMSPRISFSYDHFQSGNLQISKETPRSNSSGSACSEFYFPFDKSSNQEYSSADELFCDGKLLPLNKSPCPLNKMSQLATPLSTLQNNIDNSKEGAFDGKIIKVDQTYKNQSSKSFWSFKRSRSMGCISTLCPSLLLSRSNSTGSAPHNNIGKLSQNVHKNHSTNHSSLASMKTSELSSLMTNQRPPLKKNYKSFNKGGIPLPVSPALNVSSGNMFGLGSFFNARAKSKK